MIFFLISSVLKLLESCTESSHKFSHNCIFLMHISLKISGSGTSSIVWTPVIELAVSTEMPVQRDDDFAEDLGTGASILAAECKEMQSKRAMPISHGQKVTGTRDAHVKQTCSVRCSFKIVSMKMRQIRHRRRKRWPFLFAFKIGCHGWE